jgi:hypothetical protein
LKDDDVMLNNKGIPVRDDLPTECDDFEYADKYLSDNKATIVKTINGIPVRTDLPTEWDDGEYERKNLTGSQTNTVAELSITNSFVLEQIMMPMVLDFQDRDRLLMMFQRFVAAELLAAIDAELITEKFYNDHINILDKERGILDGITLDAHGLYCLVDDLLSLIGNYLVVMGMPKEIFWCGGDEKDAIYMNPELLTPRKY